ncbi:PH domain-containing protein [Nubsella zeaxanthinifaciens]|uniref:PH domain-containing protein n=1 Tax=Nubsella zeaxanthinifaciens TaxID=392412 RepID=UPI0018E4E18F|nr:PH domain-containing protein [Nubsella zeaxanthinifaciens]
MFTDFSKPQRQSAAGIIINGAYIVQKFVRAMFIPLALFIVKSNNAALLYAALGLAGILVVSLIYAYFYYLKFTFYLDPKKQEFVIDKGVFGRKHLNIPVEKIQQVNINQGFLQKLIGVYSLQIDTAGTESKEVNIKAINGEIAYALKEHLLTGNNVTELPTEANLAHDVDEKVQETPIVKIGASTLLKVGLTSNYGQSIALLIGFGYAVFHNIKELLKAFDNDRGQLEEFFKSGITLISIGILFTGIIIILLATNVIRTFIKYFDFQLSKHQKSLLISSGLFAKKNTLLHPSRVQITTYSQNYFQKKIGLFNMTLKQAHAGHQPSENEMKSNNMEVPGCNADEKEEILKMVLKQLPEQGRTFSPNFRFLNLPLFFTVVVPLMVYAFIYNLTPEIRPFYGLAVMYVVLVTLMIYISYTKHRIVVSEDFIIKQSGIWDISQEIIEPHKIQSISTSQYPWHRKLDIGHVTLHTAAGDIRFLYGNYTEIKTLVNWWLYKVESTEKDWM